MDYEVVAAALQNLWDDQLLGHRGRQGDHNLHVSEQVDFDDYYHERWWPEDEWWYDDYYTDQDYPAEHWDWWQDEWAAAAEAPATLAGADDDGASEKLKEAQKAEQVAESLAAEANRTWSEAQKATQALRRDRGFGAVNMTKGGNAPKCFNCGGNHFVRECPDRRHPGFHKGGRGKFSSYAAESWPTYTMDYHDHYFVGKGKNKGRGKGKKGMWLEAQWMKGKGKSKSKVKEPSRTVNAYATDYFVGGLELSENLNENLELNSADALGHPDQVKVGMLDCGATASAAPEAVVQGLISAVLSVDRGARVELDQASRPYFRFGNGKWGRALCRTHIYSDVSGVPRHFSLYTLPNPSEYYQSHFDKASLVPILVGMDFLGPQGTGMMIDFTTGLAMKTKESNPKIFQLDINKKGHLTLDIVHHLTRGHVRSTGQAHVILLMEEILHRFKWASKVETPRPLFNIGC